MKHLSIVLFTFIQLCVMGCASTPQVSTHSDLLFNDSAFSGFENVKIETEEEIFALDKPAIEFVRKVLNAADDPVDQMESLVRNIFDRSEFNLLYMGNANTTAMQTFNNRAANCLSMSIMTYALAREAGFLVRFQDIKIPEYWTRRDGYSLLNGHINLRILPRDRGNVVQLLAKGYEVDFDPQSERAHFEREFVDKATVVAMFYNNKGADALVSEDYTRAYAYFKRAIELAPQFDSALVNMGILYRIGEQYDYAKAVYNQALSLNSENLTAWENLAYLYEATGEQAQAQAIRERVERRREDNPFYHFILGEQELEEGNLELALKHYRDALKLDKSKHEIYFGLAKTYYQMGDINRSQMYFKRAMSRSRNGQDQERYQGKLDLLTKRNNESI